MMWLARQIKRTEAGTEYARLGQVTVAGDPAAVYLDGERRALPAFGPGGYCWRPAVDQEVLVLKAGAAGETLCVAGARCQGDVEPGEVRIFVPDGPSIHLKRDGTVDILGKSLRFNGAELAVGGETVWN